MNIEMKLHMWLLTLHTSVTVTQSCSISQHKHHGRNTNLLTYLLKNNNFKQKMESNDKVFFLLLVPWEACLIELQCAVDTCDMGRPEEKTCHRSQKANYTCNVLVCIVINGSATGLFDKCASVVIMSLHFLKIHIKNIKYSWGFQ